MIMKKVFLSLALCLVTLCTSAQQLKSAEGRLNLRGDDAGFGYGVTFELDDNFELSPSLSIVFPNNAFVLTTEVDLHYLLPEFVENLEIYPLTGIGFFYKNWDYDDWPNQSKFLINIGSGARWHFSDQWAVFAEEKIQFVNSSNTDNYFVTGISYSF